MTEFNDLQVNLGQSRRARQSEQKTVFRIREKLNRLQRQKGQALRSYGRDSKPYQTLLEREAELSESLTAQQAKLAGATEAELGLLKRFETFTDPRVHVAEHSDQFPILLFPVRLETRFKEVQAVGGGIQHQLWVRIFPDDCSIDSFDDTLTEAEVKQAQNYWISVWKAGTAGDPALESYVRDKVLGAWRELMGTFNAGRAYWISTNYQPENAADIPVRHNQDERILVIPSEDPPDSDGQAALQDYWRAVFLAGGDLTQTTAAFEALAAAPGMDEDRARRLIESYPPQNLEPRPDANLPPPDVQVVFLVFPNKQNVATKLSAWSQAARVTTFPERFMLLGYQTGQAEAVIEEMGQPVVDPLIVGPDPGADINQVLQDVYGPDFENFSEDEKAEKYIEYLSGVAETKWLFDFDEAVRVGMGFKVDISESLYREGIDRLFVLGVKLSANKDEGQALLEQLIHNHHFGESGFSLLPQGTPTNNTGDTQAGYSVNEDPNQAYDRYHPTTPPDDPADPILKLDGRWLAELLGIDGEKATLNQAAGYYHTDQREARAMNTALWNATMGYFMESMLTPVFSDWQRYLTRWFLINFVSGRGRLPAVRIGDQPYGILPVSIVSNLGWLTQDDSQLARSIIYSDYLPALQGIYAVLLGIKGDWEELLDQVAYVGKEGDAHQILLKTLGLHAASVEFDQRYAESFLHLFNSLKAQGVDVEDLAAYVAAYYKQRGIKLLEDLGYDHDEAADPVIPILEKYFLTKENNVTKPLIDDRKLSEIDKIRAYAEGDLNYIEWLLQNARENHQNIRDQIGFLDNKAPYTLLYDMLRQALNLEFANTGLNYYQLANILDPTQAAAARVDADFIGIQAQPTQLESKWDLIYRSDSRLTDPGVLLVDHISNQIKGNIVNSQTRQLQEVIAALELLKDAPTARLERAFVEHLDACTYRLDAWLLGFVNMQLQAMRYGSGDGEAAIRPGIYLGAYGWLEEVKPEEKKMSPAELSPELQEIFDPDGEKTPMIDESNAGYVHAPSINHGMTAAVLRNAYISHASPAQAEPYKVNLSSERVRLAMAMLEGIQQGQSLGALLGYQLERGLHDNTSEELDIFIYELRKVFPFRSNLLVATQIKTGRIAKTAKEAQRFAEEEGEFEQEQAITKIEARNVVNGLALLEHIKKTKQNEYPFGFPIGEGAGKLMDATTNERKAINAEVQRLMNIRDAVADLAMAESVHQVVQGNYERAAGALDTYSKGRYPQMPDVARSSTSGISLTHRFGIHLSVGPPPAGDVTPRAKAEPAIHQWLVDLFPTDLTTIACQVTFKIPDYEEGDAHATVEKVVTLADLKLQPVDLLYMLDVKSDRSLTALDEHILKFVYEDDDPPEEQPRPDVELQINYTQPLAGKITFFELATMIASLRALLIAARPVLPTDIALQNEAGQELNNTTTLDIDLIKAAKTSVENLTTQLGTDVTGVIDPLVDMEDFQVALANKAAIIAQSDAVAAAFSDHLRELSLHGIPQAGFGFIYDRQRAIYSAIIQTVMTYKQRWLEKDARYQDLINNQLPAAADDTERIRILQEAERIISTQATIPTPTVVVYQADLVIKKNDFDQKLLAIQALLDSDFFGLAALVDAVNDVKNGTGGQPGLADFDVQTIDIDEQERQILVFAEDINTQSGKLVAALTQAMSDVQDLITTAETSSSPSEVVKLLTEAAKAIFGPDFQVVPRFKLGETHGNELQNCFSHQSQLLDYQTNQLLNDFPVDEWLYGSARVRPKLGAWENLAILAEGFKNTQTLDLTPLQLPYREDDRWLGLEVPPDYQIEGDKLLYTAYLPAFDPSQLQCGLLVDEWTEVIPTRTETTGMTFHYDRPNSEPPQSMLLVTPAKFAGGWQWADLVATLQETLNLAKLRAVEPDQIDRTDYAQFLPATVAPVTMLPVTIVANYLLQANLSPMNDGGDNE
jgi:hypothetical protein